MNRIQRRRTKGWRMPEGSIYVGRPTKWGNPFAVGMPSPVTGQKILGRAEAVELYRLHIGASGLAGPTEMACVDLAALRGHDLACWCPLDQPCHADVLLELANR